MNKALTMTLAMALAGGSMAGQAYEQGDWILRLGATTVAPDTKSDDINLPGGGLVLTPEELLDYQAGRAQPTNERRRRGPAG